MATDNVIWKTTSLSFRPIHTIGPQRTASQTQLLLTSHFAFVIEVRTCDKNCKLKQIAKKSQNRAN